MAQEVKRKSIEMDRADKAWEFAMEGKQKAPKKYPSHVKEFPMLILTNGLLNAAAFAFEKGKVSNDEGGDKGWELIYQHIGNWLGLDNENGLLKTELDESGELITVLISLKQDATKLRLVTTEIIALFTWLKRFVA